MLNNIPKSVVQKLLLAVLGILLTYLMAAGALAPVQAAPPFQSRFLTPTPLPDGRIIYTVRANDTLLAISLISGVPIEELRGINNLTTDTIFEGQKLLLGLEGPAEVTLTPGPTPTPTLFVPTPTSKPGFANLCILLFDDVNGDSMRQDEEVSIPKGAISLNNRSGTISLSAQTAPGFEPHCFEDIPEGDYSVSVGVPGGYNATTSTNYAITLKSGDETYIDFGAQPNAERQAAIPLSTEEGGKSPLLGIIGGLFLLSGVGLAVVASFLLKNQ